MANQNGKKSSDFNDMHHVFDAKTHSSDSNTRLGASTSLEELLLGELELFD